MYIAYIKTYNIPKEIGAYTASRGSRQLNQSFQQLLYTLERKTRIRSQRAEYFAKISKQREFFHFIFKIE